jgi:hypothetical protein
MSRTRRSSPEGGAGQGGECAGKHPHETREEAQHHRAILLRSSRYRRRKFRGRALPLAVYRCSICNFWHVGHDVKR